MANIILYVMVAVALIFSFIKSRKKTIKALKKAWKSFGNLLPKLLGIIPLVGIMLALLNPVAISKIIGETSGWVGVVIATVVGAITMMPGFIAFPTSAMLLKSGAGYMQIAGFVSSLMMVGIITFPLEVEYFGKKVTLLRNLLALIFSFVVAYIIGMVV